MGQKSRNVEMHWEKALHAKLVALGLTWEQAREVTGLVAEERQASDRVGYCRGFNDAHKLIELKELR